VGAIGYCLHRLWVGLAAACITAAVALSVFSYYRILPDLAAFNESYPAAAHDATQPAFALLDAGQQREYVEQSPQKWARDFWAHLTRGQADVERKIGVIGAVAALIGLLLGTLATRPALIVCTALVGTSLVAAGLMVLAAALFPEYHQSALDHPRLLAGAGAGLLLSSLLLQAMLTRRPPPRPIAAPAR
ncbi:MAG: hypothetical protein ACYSVY_16975, partial [Planctomycetota bacterium]